MNRPRSIFIFLLLLTIVAGVAACGRYELEVRNETNDVLDIYIDEFYEGSVAPDNYLLIRHLSRGQHHVEALNLREKTVGEDVIYIDDNSRWVIDESYSRFY